MTAAESTKAARLAAMKAAMVVAKDVAEGRLSPAALAAETLEALRQLAGTVVGPGDMAWPLQLDIARGVLAAGGIPAGELSEWLATARHRDGDSDSDGPAATESDETPVAGVVGAEHGSGEALGAAELQPTEFTVTDPIGMLPEGSSVTFTPNIPAEPPGGTPGVSQN